MNLNSLFRNFKTTTIRLASEFVFQPELEFIGIKNKQKDKHGNEPNFKVIAEPKNPHDKNALAVYAYGLKVGYIPKGKQASYKAYKGIRNLEVYSFKQNDEFIGAIKFEHVDK